MNQRSRSTLFLIEQLIVVAVFALCSAACVRILTRAYFDARTSKDVSNAILVAENAAECFKAVSGDISKVSETLGGICEITGDGASVTVYYDKEWETCDKNEVHYIFHLIYSKPAVPPTPVISGEILIKKLSGEELLTFSVAAAQNDPTNNR
jgi:type II secretory pathway pseudopilin PulG